MLVRLTLKNFEQHEDLTVNFTSGLQVIRGANEKGKSTLFRAIAYAWWGSRALVQSLEETVTWDRPASSLRVELVFISEGVEYTIVRKKSGAELSGGGVTASGQAEVTAFVERLFGATASVAKDTMLANQKALTDGMSTNAVPLIEQLANMSLIDDLISKIQKGYPTGNSKALESQLETWGEDQKPVLETASLMTEMRAAQLEWKQLEADANSKQDAVIALRPLAESGAAKQAEARRVHTALEMLDSQEAAAKLAAAEVVPVRQHTAALRAKQQAQAEQSVVNAAHAAFETLAPFPTSVNRSDFEASFSSKKQEFEEATRVRNDLKVKIARLDAKLITESACGLCGKDLADVPEVVTKNAQVTQEIQKLVVLQASNNATLVALATSIKKDEDFLAEVARYSKTLPTKFVEWDHSTLPPQLRWTGPEPKEADTENYALRLSEAEAANAAADKAESRVEAAKSQLVAIAERRVKLVAQELSTEEVSALTLIGGAMALCDEAKLKATVMSDMVVKLRSAIRTAEAIFAAETKTWESNRATAEKLRGIIAEYHFNNALVARLREIRPTVAAKLWALVLTGVSHYFSQIRGTPSTVTRGEKGFRIDGKPFAAFSGSAQDSLGLATRLMLLKTFMPTVGFLMLDEPGAACDDQRESDMLAQLATCGLDQVILVTHSELADTFAANVIRL